MKIIFHIRLIILSCIVLFGLTGCFNVSELIVTPKENLVPVGQQIQLKAEKLLTKGKVVDVTSSEDVKWRSSDESLATIDENGLVSTGDTEGVVEITAIGTFRGVEFQDSTFIHIIPASIASITVSPKVDSTAIGLTKAYTATANFSNGQALIITDNSALTWSSSNTRVATVANTEGSKGVAKAISIGETSINATLNVNGESFSDDAKLKVTQSIPLSLEVTPKDSKLAAGLTKQFRARLTFSNDTEVDVTKLSNVVWTSSDPSIASVSDKGSSKGLVEAHRAGTVDISASARINGELMYGVTTLEVTDAVITSLNISSDRELLPQGIPTALKAFATLSNGTAIEVTQDEAVSWSSSNSNRATVSNSPFDRGIVTGHSSGKVTATVFIEVNGIPFKAKKTLYVVPAQVERLLVSSITQESETGQLLTGTDVQFMAEVEFANGERIDVTHSDNLYWRSSQPEIASISNRKESRGLAFGVEANETTISAKFLSEEIDVEDSAQLIVIQP
jgi:uncharacterized protein YjdB